MKNMEPVQEKKNKLISFFDNSTKENIALAFSGGVDSTLLLKIACEQAILHNTIVHTFTIHTMLHPVGEIELTRKLTEEYGAVHHIIYVDELTEAGIEENPVNRCYRCKFCMFSKLKKQAETLNIKTIIDGTNLDDTKVYRPGIQALEELDIISPLKILGFSKKEVRSLAREYKIAVSDRPSTPCMATRFPYGVRLERELLARVENMERDIQNLGFYNVRTRIHGNLVRIEVDLADMPRIIENREAIIQIVKNQNFDYVTIDLEGFRSGSMDIRIINK